MKAILVVDMPNSCDECEFCGFSVEDINERSCFFIGNYSLFDFDVESGKHEYCPLKPMPEKIEDEENDLKISVGWNACIDELLGEK